MIYLPTWHQVRDRIRWLRYRLSTIDWSAGRMELLRTAGIYAQLMRLNKPIGGWLLLWPCLWALWTSADGKPQQPVFIVFVLGVWLTRSAGCIINDIADRKIDGHVLRTRERPLVTGAVSVKEALALFPALSLIAFGLVLTLDLKVVKLAAVALAIMVSYPFLKRFFPAPQFYMAVAFSWSIPMVFVAQTGSMSRLCWLLFTASIVWGAAYDTMYAMVDRDDDRRIGVRSTALLFGDADKVIIGAMQLMMLYALWLAGKELHLEGWYRLGLAAAAGLMLYQQWLIRTRERERCFRAFLNNHYLGMVVFVGTALEYLFR